MMLADPCLVEPEPIEPLDQFEVALEALGRVFLVRMKRRQKDAVSQIDLAHRRPLGLFFRQYRSRRAAQTFAGRMAAACSLVQQCCPIRAKAVSERPEGEPVAVMSLSAE